MTAIALADDPLGVMLADARRVEQACPGWRCVWLPIHGSFLAWRDVLVPALRAVVVDGQPVRPHRIPAFEGRSANEVVHKIRTRGDMADLAAVIREYLQVVSQ